jgi:hypothetical protein
MDLVPPLVRCHLAGRRTPSSESTVPLTAAGPDETGPSSLPCFEQELLVLVCFVCNQVSLTVPVSNNNDKSPSNVPYKSPQEK